MPTIYPVSNFDDISRLEHAKTADGKDSLYLPADTTTHEHDCNRPPAPPSVKW
jgi:hypothetical protein